LYVGLSVSYFVRRDNSRPTTVDGGGTKKPNILLVYSDPYRYGPAVANAAVKK
jgi:hypothetical protein